MVGVRGLSYQGERDLVRMIDLIVEARAVSGDWTYPHVGDLVWGFLMVSCRWSPQGHIRLWVDDSGRLAGYAILGGDSVCFDWQAAPGPSRRRIDAEALAWVASRLSALRSTDPWWRRPLSTLVREDDAERAALLQAHGFERGGPSSREVHLLRSLGDRLPESPLPVGACIRTARSLNSLAARADVHRDTWAPHEVANLSAQDVATLMALPGYDAELDLIAISDDGTPAAFVTCWADARNRIGDLGPVGARPAYRRRGLTRAALCEGLRRLKALGMERVCVSTGAGNDAALALYQSVGFSIVTRSDTFTERGGPCSTVRSVT